MTRRAPPAAATCCGSASSTPTGTARRLARLGEDAEPLLALLGRDRRPGPGARRRCSGWPTPSTTRTPCSPSSPTTRAPRCGCSRCSAPAQALGDHLVRHPEQWRELDRPDARAHPPGGVRRPGGPARGRRCRPARRRCRWRPGPTPRRWTRCGWSTAACCSGWPSRDLAHHLGVDDVAAELADLAAGALDAALAVARARVGEDAATVRLAVIAMGKCGGHELNYVSDVDVIFVHEPVGRDADPESAAAAHGDPAGHPPDAGLLRAHRRRARSGRSTRRCGPRARPARSSARWPATRGYYERWAKTWEFQALLKARPVAGDLDARPASTSDGRRPDGVVGGRARRVRRRRAGDASPRRRAHPGRARPSGSSSSGRRAARRRVRRPAAPARARPGRRRRLRARPR